jgi:hypothetical protein
MGVERGEGKVGENHGLQEFVSFWRYAGQSPIVADGGMSGLFSFILRSLIMLGAMAESIPATRILLLGDTAFAVGMPKAAF